MNLNDALDTFLDTDASYGGGLSNHGPMAAEALVHLGVPQWIGPFVDRYRPRLDGPGTESTPAPEQWRDWLRQRLSSLVAAPESQAGHGLLRVAHAVGGLERAEIDGSPVSVSLRELGAAVSYWEMGGAIFDGPDDLVGPFGVVEWLDNLGRLDPARRSDGVLTVTLADAARMSGFTGRVTSLAPSSDPTAMLDVLGAAAAERFRQNVGSSAFAILHGTTVSAMATVLLPHLDDAGKRQLVAGVAGFVAAAVVGFDDQLETPDQDPPPDPPRLAELSAATMEDHTIKFADACISIAKRSGDRQPLAAAFQQINRPYGLM
jgi:hypothetical protein